MKDVWYTSWAPEWAKGLLRHITPDHISTEELVNQLNEALRIPLPSGLQKAEKAMRLMGMGKQADELVLSMNRAAEAAVPEAKTLLVKSVREMSLQDAKGILTGGDTAATDFFRRKTETELTRRFAPIVKKTTDRVGLAQQYNK